MKQKNRSKKLKVAVIHGQNHKGSTYNIGRMIANKIANEAIIAITYFPFKVAFASFLIEEMVTDINFSLNILLIV